MNRNGLHVSPRAMSLLIDGELDLLSVREARIHVSRCGTCRERLAELEEIDTCLALSGKAARSRPGILPEVLAVIREWNRELAKPTTRDRRPPALPSLAVAAVVTFVLAVGIARWTSEGSGARPAESMTAREDLLPILEVDPPPPAPPALVEAPREAPTPAPMVPLEAVLPPDPVPEASEVVRGSTEGMAAGIPPDAPVQPEGGTPPEEPPEEFSEAPELAMNPGRVEIVYSMQEEESRSADGSGDGAESIEVVPWIALAALPAEMSVEPEPDIRLRSPPPLAPDDSMGWLASTEDRLTGVLSLAFEVPAWN